MHFCIVKRDVTFKSIIPVILILAVTFFISFLSSAAFIYIPFFVIIAGISLAIYLAPRFLKTEYEYNLEGDEFSIALIRNNSSRKELFACEIKHLVTCTPFDDRDNSVRATAHINAASSQNSLYHMIFTEEGKTVTVTFSPSDDFVKELRLLAPSKVKCNILH